MKQLVEKKMELYDKNTLEGNNNYWDFYQALNLVNSNEKYNIDFGKRNNPYKKLFLQRDQLITQKILLKLQTLVSRDRRYVSKYLKKQKEMEDQETFFGTMYRKGTIAILSFEYE